MDGVKPPERPDAVEGAVRPVTHEVGEHEELYDLESSGLAAEQRLAVVEMAELVGRETESEESR